MGTRIRKNNPRAKQLIFSAKEITVYSKYNDYRGTPLPTQCISPNAWKQGHVSYCTPSEYVWAVFQEASHSYLYWNLTGWTVYIHGNEYYDLMGAEL